MRFHLALGLSLLMLAAPTARAVDLATVTGTVADYDGRPLADAAEIGLQIAAGPVLSVNNRTASELGVSLPGEP
ncbi:MAG TPA: hypothetical protein VJV75_11505 [Candidatus Polarisedimenticolia bacterium]|nr:hypothetical protein [Candidatus Polarisedimenticolia bacterium]